jgi:peptide/nickel transport system substrate-binding protein
MLNKASKARIKETQMPRDFMSTRTRRLTRRDAIRAFAGVGAASLLAACGTSSPSAPGQAAGGSASGGTLRIAEISNPRTFTPLRQLSFWAWGGIYDSLLRYKADGSLVPHLAESYQISDDGTSVTIKLRSGVKFHSGRDFTSEDVAWVLEKLKEPSTGALFRTFALAVTEIQRPDAQTLVLKLEQPEAGILDLMGNLYIPDKEIYDDIDRKGAGTGPFEFVEFVPDDHITLKRNDNYWGQKAALDRIEIKIFGDNQAAVANLEANAVDMTPLTLQDYVRLTEGKQYQTEKIVGASIFNIWLNTRRPPFDNKQVRQAMAFALDRERFNQTILLNQSQATNNPLPSYHWAFFPDLDKVYQFNLDKARSMLAAAGLPSGFETTVNVSSQSREGTGMVQILQSDLEKIGVKLTIDAKDAPRWAEASDRGEFDVNMHAYGRTNADPSLLFKGTTAWRPDANPTGFANPKYLELVNAQARVIDREKRKPLVKNLVQYVQDQCFIIPIAGGVTAYGISPKVKGLELLPVGIVAYMEQVSLE